MQFPESIIKEHQSFRSALTSPQQKVLNEYINSSENINNFFLEGFRIDNKEHVKSSDKKILQQIKNLDDIFKKIVINNRISPFTVYRGIRTNPYYVQQIFKAYNAFTHPQYMSTSIHRKVATDMFAGDTGSIFIITIDPKLTTCPKFMYVSKELSTTESEVLFERNTHLILTSYKGGNIFYVNAVNKAPPIPPVLQPKPLETQSLSITDKDIEEELEFIDKPSDLQDAIKSITDSLSKTYISKPYKEIEASVNQYFIKNPNALKQTGGTRCKQISKIKVSKNNHCKNKKKVTIATKNEK